MKPNCRSLPCKELRHKRDLYLMKSEMLGYLRREHRRYWALYEKLYDHGGWRQEQPDDENEKAYSDRAKELLTRCRMFDNLYTNLVRLDRVETGEDKKQNNKKTKKKRQPFI